MTSSVDIGNPIYARSTPSVRYERDTIIDYILDDEQDSHVIKIEYDYYEYDRACRLVGLKVTTKCKSQFLEEDVLEMIRQRERKRVELECSLEHINKQP